jgi:hypothetical protein
MFYSAPVGILEFELEDLISTLCFLQLRYDLNHCPALPLIQ